MPHRGSFLRPLRRSPAGVAELADLDQIPDATSVVIESIDGMAGVGKTALAVHAAHQMAGHYPDGQLFLDLHGYTEGGAPVEPGDALDRVLRALGVPGDRIPQHIDDRAALYRSMLADRKVLVLLDNAASEAQVAPLLPGMPGCLVMVTSRRRLSGLEPTRVVSLDVLPPDDAVALFSGAAGDGRTAGAAPETLAEVVEMCGRLPLALRVAAARLRSRPAWTTETLVDRLRDHRTRLAEGAGRSVGAALELSYQDLDPRVRRGYRLLALHPGADLDAHAAAALLDTTVEETAPMIDELVDAHLLQEPAADRFRFHDLVREHARRTSIREEAEPDRRAAITRLLDHYRHTASVAMDVAYPHERHRRPAVPPAPTPIPELPDPIRAATWLDSELSNILPAARHACEHGPLEHAPHLSTTLQRHVHDRGRNADAVSLYQHALAAARKSGDRCGEAEALVSLGQARRLMGRAAQAAELLELALATARAADHPLAELAALTNLGRVHLALGSLELAAESFRKAVQGARRIADRSSELEALYGLAWHHLHHGDPATAEFERCLALARSVGDRMGENLALKGLGHAHRMDGRFAQATECFEQALHVSRAAGNERAGLASMIGLASVHRQQGHEAPAADLYQQVLELARETGNTNYGYEAVQGLGRLHCAAGRPGRAITHHQQALDLATRLGQLGDEARAHDGLARAHRALGDREHARRHWQAALEILTELGTDVTEDEEASTSAIRSNLNALDRGSVD
jgi:tetratricopeptide (TPR) repeat protein